MHLSALTSLRFFAAIFVVFSHLSYLPQSKYFSNVYTAFLKEGYIGVTFFFILSGFILSFSYAKKMDEISFKSFMIARVSRIYPLHLLTFFLALPLALLAGWKGMEGVVPNLLLIQSFIPNESVYFSVNSPSWSISNEMFFYLLFPFLIKMKPSKLLLIFILIAFYQIALVFLGVSEKGIHAFLYISPLSRLADFTLGILLFTFFKNKREVSDVVASFLQYFSVLLLIAFIFFKSEIPQGYRYDLYYMLPMAIIVLSFSYGNGYLSKLISSKLLILLGEASFALYLVHQIVIRYIVIINQHLFEFSGFYYEVLSTLLIISVSLIVSIWLFKNFEIKSKKSLHAFLNKIWIKSPYPEYRVEK